MKAESIGRILCFQISNKDNEKSRRYDEAFTEKVCIWLRLKSQSKEYGRIVRRQDGKGAFALIALAKLPINGILKPVSLKTDEAHQPD